MIYKWFTLTETNAAVYLCQLESQLNPNLEQAVVHYVFRDTTEMGNELFRTCSRRKVFLLERRKHLSLHTHLLRCQRIVAEKIVLVDRCFSIDFEYETILCVVCDLHHIERFGIR